MKQFILLKTLGLSVLFFTDFSAFSMWSLDNKKKPIIIRDRDQKLFEIVNSFYSKDSTVKDKKTKVIRRLFENGANSVGKTQRRYGTTLSAALHSSQCVPAEVRNVVLNNTNKKQLNSMEGLDALYGSLINNSSNLTIFQSVT